MMSIPHNLDIRPEPERVLYINEIGIADNTADQQSYDQVWYVRERHYADSPEDKHHSQHGKRLVEEILDILEQWEENGIAECFPIDQIDELEEEYEIVKEHH